MSEAASFRVEHLETRRTGRVAALGASAPGTARALWIVLHGYGELAADFVQRCRVLDDGGRTIVAPEALSRFYDASAATDRHAEARVGASWMTREDRLAEIADQQAWLDRVLTAYRPVLRADGMVVVLGFSQGAAAASRWVAARDPGVAHLICWGAGFAPEIEIGPGSVLARTRCTLVVGDRDRFVPAERVAVERARLEAAGLAFGFERFAGGHRLDDETLARLAG